MIASGHAGGGHVGRIGTILLVPRVVDAVSIPVVAAGGLADGRGLVAALALGAVGVWMGTRFIATAEACGHDNYKRRITEIRDVVHGALPCGQSAALIERVEQAGEVVAGIARQVLSRLAALGSSGPTSRHTSRPVTAPDGRGAASSAI